MKRTTCAEVVTLDGVELRINNGNGEYLCYLEILKAISAQLHGMLSYHSKVLVLRMDLHLDRFTTDNRELSRFIDKIKRHLSEHYKAKRLGYIWVREHEKAKQQHYHLALMIDANKIQHPGKLINWIEQRWENRNHPKPYTPEHCFYIVQRGNQTVLLNTFERLSYLAKTRGKGYRDNAVNDYSSSRIKPKGAGNEH